MVSQSVLLTTLAITIIYLLQKFQKHYQKQSKWRYSCNHLFIAKISKALPKVIQMTMRCSRSPLWRNTAGLCEVQSRIYVVNRWKYYPDYFPDPLALSELVSWRRARACIFQTHTSPETRHVAICDECRREPMSVWLSCRKRVVWSGNIWIRNERVSQSGLCGLPLLDSLLGMERKIAE